MTKQERADVLYALNNLAKEVSAGKIQEFVISFEGKMLAEAIKRPIVSGGGNK